MKRTTIYLEPELEVLLKMEMLRTRQTMASIVREAVLAYVTRGPDQVPPGAGEFASGHADTAERAETILSETGFGEGGELTARATGARPVASRPAARGGRPAPKFPPRVSGRTRRRR
jgi:hypothetical protein